MPFTKPNETPMPTVKILEEDSWLTEEIIPNEMEVHYAIKRAQGYDPDKLPSDILQDIYGTYSEDGIDLYDEGNIR